MSSINKLFAISSAMGVDLNAVIDDAIDEALNETDKHVESDAWYNSLDMNQRVNLKELTDTICGMSFEFMVKVFGFKEAIFHIHSKLKIEGFDV